MGRADDVAELVSRYNTAHDGSRGASLGTRALFGPGFTMQVPTSTDTVTQVMVSVTEQEIAWPVLSRLCKDLGWRMMDTETGQVFG